MSESIRCRLVAALLILLLAPSVVLALPSETGAAERPGPVAWMLGAFEDLVALFSGDTVGPGKDPDGLTAGNPSCDDEAGCGTDVGPGKDPNG
jgi:hypothetical protein